jgi:eukaryotic-like serine/threonine-protein kinase
VEKIGRYVIERQLGQGALATVHLGKDEKLHRQVAIKVLSASGEQDDLRRRFQLEARAIAALKHENIVQLFDYADEDSRSLFLVMEYVPGKPVSAFLDQRGPLSEQTALCIGHQLVQALEHAHSHHVVHRDVKPSNVLLHDGRVVLIDFGGIKVIDSTGVLGKEYNDSHTRAVGTPGFMAPEQFEGRDIDERTDIFALGALLYNVTTDALPYHGSDLDKFYEAVAAGRYRDPRDYQPLLTSGFCALLGDCMAAKSSERLQSAAVVRKRIEELLAAHGVTDPKADLAAYARDPSRAAVPQQNQSVQALLRDLKLALFRELQAAVREKDGRRAQSVIRRMQRIVPIDDEEAASKLHRRQQILRGSRRRLGPLWYGLGMLTGVLVTALLIRYLVLDDAQLISSWLCEQGFVGFGRVLP